MIRPDVLTPDQAFTLLQRPDRLFPSPYRHCSAADIEYRAALDMVGFHAIGRDFAATADALDELAGLVPATGDLARAITNAHAHLAASIVFTLFG